MQEPWVQKKRSGYSPEERKKLRVLARVAKAASAVAVFLFCGFRTSLWLLICVLTLVALVGIYARFPLYFTFVPTLKGWNSSKTGQIDLTLPFFFAAFMLFTSAQEDLFHYEKLFLFALAGTAVMGGLLLLSGEYREEKKNLWVLIVAFLLCGSLLYWTNKVYDMAPPQISEAVVEEIERKAFEMKGSTNEQFYCTVVLQDGRRYCVEISSVAYELLEKGDPVVFRLHSGALGMEYGGIVIE